MGNKPVFFIDSVRVSQEDLEKYNVNDVAAVSVYKGKTAIELLGDDGKDGVVVHSSTPEDLNKAKVPSKVQKVKWVDEQKSEKSE